MDRRQSKIHSLYLHCKRTQKGTGLCHSYGKGDIHINVKFKYSFTILIPHNDWKVMQLASATIVTAVIKREFLSKNSLERTRNTFL